MNKKKILRNKRNIRKNKGKVLKTKNLYLKEDSSSSDEDDSDSDSRRVLFMKFKETIENNEDNYEGEVNIEEELIISLHDLKKERKKNKQLKEELSKMNESCQNSINTEETKKVFIDLKVKFEEAKVIEEIIRKQLEEKEMI